LKLKFERSPELPENEDARVIVGFECGSCEELVRGRDISLLEFLRRSGVPPKLEEESLAVEEIFENGSFRIVNPLFGFKWKPDFFSCGLDFIEKPVFDFVTVIEKPVDFFPFLFKENPVFFFFIENPVFFLLEKPIFFFTVFDDLFAFVEC